jgi:hypothetical protein
VQFEAIRDSKDSSLIVPVCTSGTPMSYLSVVEGMIISVMTPTGKYCLMRATLVQPEQVRFDSCHVLL